MTCIHTIFSEVESGVHYGLTSTVTLVEVLDGSEPVFHEVMDGRKGEFLDADLPVMTLARDIRKKIKIPAEGKKFKQLDLPDCIPIATAKLSGCDCLVTGDAQSMLAVKVEIEKHFKLKLKEPCEVAAAQLELSV